MARRKRRSSRRRRNPVVLGANPRRRRSRGRRRNPVVLGANPRRRHVRRHRRHSNPLNIGRALPLPGLKEVAFLGAGAVVAGAGIPRVLIMVPFLSKNPYVRAASRVGLLAVLGVVAKKVLKENSKPFIYGAVASQIVPVANDVLGNFGVKLGLAEDAENELELYTEEAPALIDNQPGTELYTEAEETSVAVG